MSTPPVPDPSAGQCIHSRAVHTTHHRVPVVGCPWCTAEEQPAQIAGSAVDAEQLARWARREALLVLITRVQHGRTLTEDEARALRERTEAEMRESEAARARAERAEAALDRVRQLCADPVHRHTIARADVLAALAEPTEPTTEA